MDLVKKAREEEQKEKMKPYDDAVTKIIANAKRKEKEAVRLAREEASDAFLPEQGKRATEIVRLKMKLKKAEVRVARKIFGGT